jgi:hypothetical protein
MFQRRLRPFRGLLSLLDDVLGDDFDQADRTDEAPHPHRRSLRWQRERRPGSVAPRPAHCISPVRTGFRPRDPERTAR